MFVEVIPLICQCAARMASAAAAGAATCAGAATAELHGEEDNNDDDETYKEPALTQNKQQKNILRRARAVSTISGSAVSRMSRPCMLMMAINKENNDNDNTSAITVYS